MKRHVEISGGGLCGLTAGLAFAQRGWSVRVHEEDTAPRIPGAGIYIWENGLRILESLGVYDRIIDGAIAATRREMRDFDGRVFAAADFTQTDRLYVPLRRTLLTALHDALIAAGGEIVFNSRVIGAAPEGRILLADGGSASADLVIAADGINSRIRDGLGLLLWRRPARQHGFRSMIKRRPEDLTSAAGKTHAEHWHGSRRLLYAPCTADDAYVQLTSVAGDPAGNAVPIDRGFWLNLFPHLAWIIERLPKTGHSDWFSRVSLRAWHKGRVVILGDAASAQPPFLGQGGGCAMMGALSLAHAIETIGDIDRAINEWEVREKPFTERVQRVAYNYGQFAFTPPPVRRLFFSTISHSAWAQRHTILVASTRITPGTQRATAPARQFSAAA
jgi:2-polyprenyl-6-methoxyphenol hydroxylase-like FAD-dependent oxidoreductase